MPHNVIAGQDHEGQTTVGDRAVAVALGCSLITASVQKYYDIYQGEGPPLVFPLEFMAQYGRELGVAALGTLAVLAMFLPTGGQRPNVSLACRALIAIQIVLLIKFVQSGGHQFAAIAFCVYAAMWWVYFRAFPRLFGIASEVAPKVANVLTYTLAAFLALNIYQYLRNPGPAMMSQGRFHGITANPQMFALCIGVCVPAALFIANNSGTRIRKKWFAISVLIATAFFAILSGSRLAVLLVVVGVAPYMPVWMIAASAITIFLAWIFRIDPRELVGQFDAGRVITRTTDTRSMVWRRQLETFWEFPVFGRPFQRQRLRFGESSWFALMAATGVVGFIPGVFFLSSLFSIAMRLFRYQVLGDTATDLRSRNEARFLVGSISAAITGSFFEAFMLGTLTMPLLATLILIYAASVYTPRSSVLTVDANPPTTLPTFDIPVKPEPYRRPTNLRK
jgi:hypothetical protein